MNALRAGGEEISPDTAGLVLPGLTSIGCSAAEGSGKQPRRVSHGRKYKQAWPEGLVRYFANRVARSLHRRMLYRFEPRDEGFRDAIEG